MVQSKFSKNSFEQRHRVKKYHVESATAEFQYSSVATQPKSQKSSRIKILLESEHDTYWLPKNVRGVFIS
jgi:hypothetical protein